MLRVLADNHYFAFSLDDLALLADLLNGWFYLHCSTMPFLLYLDSAFLFCSPGNASLGQVVDRNLNGYAITGKNFNIIHTELARNVCSHDVTVGQLDFKGSIGQRLNNCTFKFNNVILRQNNPSYSVSSLDGRSLLGFFCL